MRTRRSVPILATLGLALAMVTVFAVPAAAHLAPWQTRGTYWAPAPADAQEHGFAQRLQTVPEDDPRWGPVVAHHGSISFSPEEGLQVDQLSALSTDVLLEEGACANGSPRFNLRVDTDGDGSRDRFVQAYPDASQGEGCPQDEWTHLDLLDDQEATWRVPGVGRLAPSEAIAALTRLYPANQITRVDLQFDNTGHAGPATIWFDDVAVHDHTLSEPADGEVVCPAAVEDPVFGGFGACPFRVA